MKRGDSLVVLCCKCNPLCLKKPVNHVTAGGLLINSTCRLCECPWKVTCSKVQWCEAFFCADVGVYTCMDGKGGMSFKEAISFTYNINKGYTKKDMSRLLPARYLHLSAANVHCSGVKEFLCCALRGIDGSFMPLQWTFAALRCRYRTGSSLAMSFLVYLIHPCTNLPLSFKQ